MVRQDDADSGKRFDWAALGWAYLFFWYFTGFTHFLIKVTDAAGFTGFRQALLMSFLWLIPLLAFPKHTRWISAVIGLVLWLTSLVGLGYFLIYGQEFSQSVIFIMFESNLAESSEYLEQYFAWWMPLVFVSYSLVGWVLWRKVRPIRMPVPARVGISVFIFLALLVYPAVSVHFKGKDWQWSVQHLINRMEPAVPWQLAFGYLNYRTQLANMERLLAINAAVPPLKNLKDDQGNQPSTIVLVIGESTNRARMSLYGYSRPTTPNLDAMRSQLDVFENVITPRPYTIEALEQILTFADQLHPDLYLSTPSALNMMKQAGYKTFWVTNQQTMTRRNTMLTMFSQQADEQVYLNHNRNQNARQYDDDVLAPFNGMLKDPAPRKFIVVHLLGTHMGYHYRYPEEYDRFTTNEGVPPWVTGSDVKMYNTYDNAVLFNDHVVSTLIKDFSATDPNGFLVYFSDHGENVFDAPEDHVPGRNEASPTPPMYTVPFMIWRSPKWQASHPRQFQDALSRLYSNSDFIHTLADLGGLNFDELDRTKSLISPTFESRPVLIGDPTKPHSLLEFTKISSKINTGSGTVSQK